MLRPRHNDRFPVRELTRQPDTVDSLPDSVDADVFLAGKGLEEDASPTRPTGTHHGSGILADQGVFPTHREGVFPVAGDPGVSRGHRRLGLERCSQSVTGRKRLVQSYLCGSVAVQNCLLELTRWRYADSVRWWKH